MRSTDDDRARALAHLEDFRRRLLPGTMRRIAAWKGLSPAQLDDQADDVTQELALDCLQHPAEVAAANQDERHARWMRLVARTLYRLQRRGRPVDDLAEDLPGPAPAATPPPIDLPPLVRLENGRPNFEATMRRSGLGRRALRRELDAASAALGWSDDRARFWQRRTSEALTALGADVLRAQRPLLTVEPLPRPPDPERRRQRLRRIAQRLPVHPSTLPARRALRAWSRGSRRDADPRAMLEQAARLTPGYAAAWLWLFEACVATGDVRAGVAAIRGARRCGDAAAAPVTLARARLLEARGRLPAAVQLLQRALRRGPRRPQLLSALRCVPRPAAGARR